MPKCRQIRRLINMDMQEYLLNKRLLIDEQLERLVPEKNVPFSQLFSAARYSLLSSGKRIRPILALAVCETLGRYTPTALSPACALELISTYSMIHDDLPCMDDDDFRRGKPTLHKAFPEGHAVLAGDYLLTYSFEILADDPHLTSDQKIKLISTLANSAGGSGMIAGQIMDIEAENKEISLEMLQYIHQFKTGALIKASIDFGAILANADQRQRSILNQFGNDIGIAFQIIDDVLDVTSSVQKHGRTIASDVINKKATYVTFLGLEESKQTAIHLLDSAVSKLKLLPYDVSLLVNLAHLIVYRNH